MKNLLMVLSCCLTIGLNGQDEIPFYVVVSSDSILLGNSFEVRFQIENASAKDFEPPAFEAFDLVGGPNQSSTMSVVNGKMNQRSSFGYLLMPREVGTYFIGPASARIGEKMLETVPVEISVLPNPDGIQQPSRIGSDELRFFHDELVPKAIPKPKPKKKLKTYKI